MWAHRHTHPNTHDRISMIYWTIRPRFSTRPFKIKTSAYKTKLFELKRRDCLFWCLIFTWPRKLSALAVYVSSFQSCFSFNLLCCPDPIDYLLLLQTHSLEHDQHRNANNKFNIWIFHWKRSATAYFTIGFNTQHSKSIEYRNSNCSSRLHLRGGWAYSSACLFGAYEQ